jgi:hypothetical protein
VLQLALAPATVPLLDGGKHPVKEMLPVTLEHLADPLRFHEIDAMCDYIHVPLILFLSINSRNSGTINRPASSGRPASAPGAGK